MVESRAPRSSRWTHRPRRSPSLRSPQIFLSRSASCSRCWKLKRRRDRIPIGNSDLFCHGVLVGDPLCATGHHPDSGCAVPRHPRRGGVDVFRRGCGAASATATASRRSWSSRPRRGPRHARYGSRFPTVGSSAAAVRNAAEGSSSASDPGNPKNWCWCPRAVSTSTRGWTASVSSPTRIPGGALAGLRAGARTSGFLPAETRNGWSPGRCVCWLCCAASLVSTFRVCWSPLAPSRVASSSSRLSSRV